MERGGGVFMQEGRVDDGGGSFRTADRSEIARADYQARAPAVSWRTRLLEAAVTVIIGWTHPVMKTFLM